MPGQRVRACIENATRSSGEGVRIRCHSCHGVRDCLSSPPDKGSLDTRDAPSRCGLSPRGWCDCGCDPAGDGRELGQLPHGMRGFRSTIMRGPVPARSCGTGVTDAPMRRQSPSRYGTGGRSPCANYVIPAATWVPHACGTAHRVPGDQNSKGRRAEWHGRRKGARGASRTAGTSGDPIGWSVSGQVPHCAGLTGDRGKCLVLRLLYSYMARGTAMKKRVWSCASGPAPAPGEVSCPRSLAANFTGTG